MSYDEFIGWKEYYSEELFLADRLEIQLARIGQVTKLAGMNKIDIPDNFFLVSEQFKSTKKEEVKEMNGKEIEDLVLKLF